MKTLISVAIILAAVYLFMQLVGFYDRTARPSGRTEDYVEVQSTASASQSLPGLPPQFEGSLQQAQSQGLEGLGEWLKTYGRHVQDPRLAAIELDYVILLNLKDHKAARERFHRIVARTPPDSPVAERLRKLAPAYEQ